MERAVLTAYNLRILKRNDEGTAVLDAVLGKDPELSSSYQFMWEWIACKYEAEFQVTNPVTLWRENRLKGVKSPTELGTDQDEHD
jgi:hypothetical protein